MIVTRWAWFVTCLAGLCGCGWLAGVTSYGTATEDSGLLMFEDAPAGSPPAPTAMFPWNGYYTGAYSAPTSLTPTFSWSPVDGDPSTYYKIALSEDCAIATWQQCDLGDGSATGSATTYMPAALAVSNTAPVGARWYWRVSACNSHGCNTTVNRYLNVGRIDNDFKETGASSLAVGANDGTVEIYDGSLLRNMYPTITTTGATNFGAALVGGDFDGDGVSDLAIYDDAAGSAGELVVYSQATSVQNPALHAVNPTSGAKFGSVSFSPGDLDADGYDDLVVAEDGRFTIFRGGSNGVTMDSSMAVSTSPGLGVSAAGVGDVDGDGYPDFVITATNGSAELFYGPQTGMSARTEMLAAPMTSLTWGVAVTGGDLDGDGFSDIEISGINASGSGYLYEFAGSPGGVGSATPLFADTAHDIQFGESLLYVRELGTYGLVVGDFAMTAIYVGGNAAALADPDAIASTYGAVLGAGDFDSSANSSVVVSSTEDTFGGTASPCGEAYAFTIKSGAALPLATLSPSPCAGGVNFGAALTH